MDESPVDEVIKSLSAYKIAQAAMETTNRQVKIMKPKLSLPPGRGPAGAGVASGPVGGKENPFNTTIGLTNQSGRVILSSTASDDYTNVVVTNLNKKTKLLETAFGRDPDELDELEDERDRPLVDEEEEQNKMNVTKEELLFLISLFKAELQTKDMALTAIKYEQLKRLLNPVEIGRSSMAETYTKLQDRLKQKIKDTNNNTTNKTSRNLSATEDGIKDVKNQQETSETQSGFNQKSGTNKKEEQENDKDHSDNLDTLNILLELLDRHPLLALPRDSLYCFDYKFDEQSTKNYLNLKIQHLESLIKQHRNYRLFMNKRLRECEQSLFNITRELEMEKRVRLERVDSILKGKESSILQKGIEQVQETLEEEKRNKLMIVMTLLAELNEERDKVQLLNETIDDLRRDREQLKENFAKDKVDLEKQIKELTVENSMLKLKLERRRSSTNVVKPAVPAKPAQLLDQKRNSNPKSQ